VLLKPVLTGGEWEKNLALISLPFFVTSQGGLFSLDELSSINDNSQLTFLCDCVQAASTVVDAWLIEVF